MIDSLNALIELLQRQFPGVRIEIRGPALDDSILNAFYKAEQFELVYAPPDFFGFTRVTAENSFMRGSEIIFSSLDAAANYLLKQLESVQNVKPDA